MRMSDRLTAMKGWFYAELCKGRIMKAPPESLKITEIKTQEPQVYLGWSPMRLDKTGNQLDPVNVCPGIVVMPTASSAKFVDDRRFDRYDNVHRSKLMGRQLNVSALFSVYEPGIRLPGFIDSADKQGKGLDLSLIQEGTENGLFTLMDWMEECMELIISEKTIPNTDMFLVEESVTYSLFTDQAYIVDRRPIFYGFVNMSYQCYAHERNPSGIEQYLS